MRCATSRFKKSSSKFGVTARALGFAAAQSHSRSSSPTSSRSRSRTGQMQIRTRSELEQLSNALLEPLFPVARGVRLLGVSLSSLAEDSAGEPEFSLPV